EPDLQWLDGCYSEQRFSTHHGQGLDNRVRGLAGATWRKVCAHLFPNKQFAVQPRARWDALRIDPLKRFRRDSRRLFLELLLLCVAAAGGVVAALPLTFVTKPTLDLLGYLFTKPCLDDDAGRQSRYAGKFLPYVRKGREIKGRDTVFIRPTDKVIEVALGIA